MTRRVIIIASILLVGGGAWFLLRSVGGLGGSEFRLPQVQFFPGRTNIPSFSSCRFNWSVGRPSPNRILIEAWGTNGWHDYFYDLQRHELVGEVSNAGPIMMNKDQTRLLCYVWLKKPQPPWVRSAKFFVRDVTGGRIRPLEYEAIGIFDLKNNSLKPIGELPKHLGFGSSFVNSPGWRYAYNQTSTMEDTPMVALCDVDEETMNIVDVGGEPKGWWDATRILSRTIEGDLVLYDVEGKSKKPLLTRACARKMIRQLVAPNQSDPHMDGIIQDLSLDPISKWNGHEYCFYLVQEKLWIKIEKQGPSLRLLGRPGYFDYEHFGHFDETDKYYICAGDYDTGKASTVFVRNLKDGSERILVPSDGSNRRSSPVVWGDEVIYEGSNSIWRVSLSSTNVTRLFPPP